MPLSLPVFFFFWFVFLIMASYQFTQNKLFIEAPLAILTLAGMVLSKRCEC